MKCSSRIGAFFDLDGTLLPPPSLEWRSIAWLLARDEISGANLARWLRQFATQILRDRTTAIEGNKHYLAGLPESLAADWSHTIQINPMEFRSSGIARIAWHREKGHRIFLVTGTLAPLARAIAEHLPCPIEICATELDTFAGRWTGWLAGEHMSGHAKAKAVAAQASRCGVVLSESFAYGDSASDIPMLSLIRHAAVINPSRRLARLAHNRGWRVCRWAGTQFADSHLASGLVPFGSLR